MKDVVLIALALVFVAGIVRTYAENHPRVICRCGAILGRAPKVAAGSMCPACTYRARHDAQAEHDYEARHRDAERAYAAAEADRRAARFPLYRAGTFGRVGTGFVLDGWQFHDPRALGERATTTPQVLTVERRQVVYGWRLEELHTEAHGPACDCLES